MKLKKFIVGITMSILFVMLIDSACSSGGEPEPVDCSKSGLKAEISASTNPSSCAVADGTVDAVATGGKEPYQFSINGGTFQSSANFSSLSSGSYIIKVRDKNGCESTANVNLVAPGAPSATVVTTANTECLTPNGSIEVTSVMGGAGPYTYKLNSGSFGVASKFENLAPGSYVVTVKDDQGCTVTKNATVSAGATGVTYNGTIKAIFVTHCNFAGCHPDNGDWFTYSTAKANASKIKTLTSNGTMPKAPQPGGALSADEKALIACWADGGAPEN